MMPPQRFIRRVIFYVIARMGFVLIFSSDSFLTHIHRRYLSGGAIFSGKQTTNYWQAYFQFACA